MKDTGMQPSAQGPSGDPARPPEGRGPDAYAWDALVEWRGDRTDPPAPAEWEEFLTTLREERGDPSAFRLIERLLPGVTERWGTETAGAAGQALRGARSRPLGPQRTDWDRAEVAIAGLPDDWQDPFRVCLDRSREAAGRPVAPKGVVLSAASLRSTAYVLQAWHAWCGEAGVPTTPSALGFETWAREMEAAGHTPITIAGRLRATLMGMRLVTPDAAFDGAAWVASDWSDAARLVPPPTKCAAAIPPATEVFELGRRLVAEADAAPRRRITEATACRDGLLLMIAAALPQRARALSHLASASTIRLLDRPLIRVELPGLVLKRREGRKRLPGYHATLNNPVLWDALDAYLRRHRPHFDDGTHLWPSSRRRGKALDPQRLSEIVAALTERHLNIRVCIHRMRDAVATEASEEMPEGGRIAPRVLGHVDGRVTTRHYDHSTGIAAARGLAAALPRTTRRRPSLSD